MSLKAKIEAVIYASEEPVTLGQLVGLLGQEGQSELDALEANQPTLGLDLGEEPLAGGEAGTEEDDDALNAEIMDTSEVAAEPEAAEPEAAPEEDAPTDPEVAPGSAEATASEPETQAETSTAVPASEDAKAARAAARKLREYFRSLLDALIAEYTAADRGFEIVEVAGGFRLRTKPEYHDVVRGFVKSLKPPLKLSLQALETLAVIAYKQPVTAPEITEIRGVDSAGTIGSLMTRKLVTTAGRKQVIGRPMLYKTTKDFLLRFGLRDINELPSIEEFEKMAGELNETLQEEIPMDESVDAIRPHSETAEEPAAAPEGPQHSPSLDERNAVPTPTNILHESPEDLMSDDSTQPEGHKHEPTAAE